MAKLNIKYVPISSLHPADYNPRKWSKEAVKQLQESIKRYGVVDPLIVNSAPHRRGIVIGGHFRLSVIKELGVKEAPVVFLNIPNIDREKELNLRLNKNTGEFDWNLLANFSEDFLADIGFSSEELDEIFPEEENPEQFDLEKELKKLEIEKIEVRPGDVYEIGPNFRLMNGDSTVEADILKLMSGEKISLCLTDPPYLLDYLRGKKKRGSAVTGFGYKRDRRYLETEFLPPDFTERWMANVAKVQKPDFSLMVFENPKNLRTIWNALEKHWKYRNTITWHVPNRVQNFSARYKFFNKHDIALIGTSGEVTLNIEPEVDELFQSEYENALFATSGKPHWESYEKNKRFCPTDFCEFIAADAKSSGQSVIFGTKPVEVLLPYMKVLSQRNDLILEPFCGSASTMATAYKLGRRCYAMEKSSVYCEIAKRRIEKLTGLKAKKLL